MKEIERKEMTDNLKTIIKNSVNDLPAGELLDLISLSARTELYLKSDVKNTDAGTTDIELKDVIRKYNQFLK
ncbi:MAG: hypothetical protein KDD00_15900 [Ignavibacteriae bacterium]|nr:hypothetical protein [Ignavibacteriota bacterium]